MRPFVAFAALLVLSIPSRAVLLNGTDATSGIVPAQPMVAALLATLMVNAIPSEPLSEGLNSVKATAGYLHFTRDIASDGSPTPSGTGAGGGAFSEKQNGGGGAATYLRGFGPHWGASVTACGGATSGTMTKKTAYTATASGPISDHGAALGAGVVYDPFRDPEGFRLPFALGATVASVSGKRGPAPFVFPVGTGNGLDGHLGEIEESYSKTLPGMYFGFAPQGNLGPVRATLFAFVTAGPGPDSTYTERDLTTGKTGGSNNSPGSMNAVAALLQFTYRPWDLSLQYALPVPHGHSSGTLTGVLVAWAHRW